MNWYHGKTVLGKLGLMAASLGFLLTSPGQAQTTFGGNAQHTANYGVAAQNLNAVHWTTSIDLNNTGGFAHYVTPVITPGNTIFVPWKTCTTAGPQINLFTSPTGRAARYFLLSAYIPA